MEPELITYLESLGYKLTKLQPDEYGCTMADGPYMSKEQQEAMRKATQQWLIRRYYH